MRAGVIFDMDGTLADVSSIRHHVRTRPKDFDAFHAESANVPANEWVATLARSVAASRMDVLVVTARRAKFRHQTAWWLALNDVPSTGLWMRADKDGRPDYEVKRDILMSIRTRWNVVAAVDDNPAVLRLWAEHGIPTLTVPGWEHE